ncbi:MAG: CDP-alcohol phosphatidyltransferase family protein [Verrucomicrobia bacterium]|nr:CDP-alcohol phosphatidyltransferase family protein [Verrucomicrobiota bacterium]
MQPTRRPIRTRDTRWAAAIARTLVQLGIRPNTISVTSALFSAGAGVCLWFAGDRSSAAMPWLLLGSAVLMQLRLLCNLFDGMVAIEGGFKTKSGEMFNELPDRFADAFILIGAGYSLRASGSMEWLGWLGAALAILTAYVRALGASAGASQHFCGPMAKQHRMAVMTLACLASAIVGWLHLSVPLIKWALVVIAAGCVITVFRRAHRIIRELESQ